MFVLNRIELRSKIECGTKSEEKNLKKSEKMYDILQIYRERHARDIHFRLLAEKLLAELFCKKQTKLK